MLDRVARLPEIPRLLARGSRLGGRAFYHVNGSRRAIPASRGEIDRIKIKARGNFFFFLREINRVQSSSLIH